MKLSEKLVRQCRKPKGFFGRLIAKGMNKGHAQMAKWGLKAVSIKSDDIILDVGCGGGQNVFNFAKQIKEGKVHGIDYSDISVSTSKRLNKKFIKSGIVELKKGSVSSLPFSDNTFDLVTGFETYYFWPDIINDLKEILRVLKSGGQLLLVNEAFKCENEELRKRNEKWSKLGDFPIHTIDEIRQFLEQAGFSNIKIETEKDEEYFFALGSKN